MKKFLLLATLALPSTSVFAVTITLFKDENGITNWQHLANWTGGTLLILLLVASMYLHTARRHSHRANRELTAIKGDLEQRVRDRTDTLDRSNKMLQESNQMLEKEVSRHVITTEQLQSSEAYIKDIMASMPLMLVSLDQNSLVTQWNKRVAEVTGISAEEALGKTLWQAYPQVTVTPEHIQQAIHEKKTIHLKQSLRSLYHFDVTIYPLKEKAGVVILVDDVTKQASAESLLIHNDKMSFMGELASTMAHDINLPLQAIMMDLRRFQRILDAGEEVEQLGDLVDGMSAKGEKVSGIISNLLSFARSRNGKKQMVDIVEVMESTISLAKEVVSVSDDLPFKQINLVRDFEKQLPLVPCYVTELQQVLISLFRHSCGALQRRIAEDGYHPKIKVQLSESYGNLWIKIQHNGVGLTGEEQRSLFEPLFADKAPEQDFDAGQRLSFSYYIVTEQHQGNMAVTSDVDIGSTIHIQLPVSH
ncbi:MAG: PAS domain S-box protein [Motiliproteus sp.]